MNTSPAMKGISTAQQSRHWTGPAVFSFGFRPFFLAGALYSAVVIAVWVPWYLGHIALPTDWPPVAWHAHELLFGYGPAIIAGFLLTAVPNWTGRLPVVGWPLAGLFALWLLGRLAVSTSAWLGAGLTATAAMAFLVALALVIGREIAAGRNWRNLKVLILVGILIAAQAIALRETALTGSSTYGVRLAIGAIIVLIALIGGRIVPSFTRNWLKHRGADRMPAPFSRFDLAVVLASAVALAAWTLIPDPEAARAWISALLGAAAILQGVRLARWRPLATGAEPLVAILHIGYAFIPLGFALAAVAAWRGDPALDAAAIHAWTAGAIGTMTLAVMTRATRGHTGRPLAADGATVLIYAGVVLAALTRILAALLPAFSGWLLSASAALWVIAFGGFAIIYGPMLVRRAPR